MNRHRQDREGADEEQWRCLIATECVSFDSDLAQLLGNWPLNPLCLTGRGGWGGTVAPLRPLRSSWEKSFLHYSCWGFAGLQHLLSRRGTTSCPPSLTARRLLQLPAVKFHTIPKSDSGSSPRKAAQE